MVNKECVNPPPQSLSGKNDQLPLLATCQFSPVSLRASWHADWSFRQGLHCFPDNLIGPGLVSSCRQPASGTLP